jgi:hypothetical protein
MATTFRSMNFADPQFEFQLMRVLGYAPFGGAALGECLWATGQMTDGDIVSWSAAWDAIASDVAAKGEASLKAGRTHTARAAFLRASNYFRAAAVWRRHDDPLHLQSWQASVEAFAKAGALRDTPVEALAIPYEGTTLPGSFFAAGDTGEPRPTLIAMGGGDASGEESYFHCAGEDAGRRGYHLFTFHGPGHRGALHQDPSLTWRHDYEVVISAVLDHLESRDDVDMTKVALYGVSLGGYVVLRAAGADGRIGAVIPNSPIVDFHQVATTPPPPPPADAPPPRTPSAELMRWALDLYQWTYDPSITSRAGWLDVIKDFNAHGLVEKISCPVLAISSEGEPPSVHPQLDAFTRLCTAPTTVRTFTEAEGADAHVQFNNIQLVLGEIYDWLDGVFAR